MQYSLVVPALNKQYRETLNFNKFRDCQRKEWNFKKSAEKMQKNVWNGRDLRKIRNVLKNISKYLTQTWKLRPLLNDAYYGLYKIKNNNLSKQRSVPRTWPRITKRWNTVDVKTLLFVRVVQRRRKASSSFCIPRVDNRVSINELQSVNERNDR